MIPLGFEPKTHSLEGCCSNPTELRNHPLRVKSGAKLLFLLETAKCLAVLFNPSMVNCRTGRWMAVRCRLIMALARLRFLHARLCAWWSISFGIVRPCLCIPARRLSPPQRRDTLLATLSHRRRNRRRQCLFRQGRQVPSSRLSGR